MQGGASRDEVMGRLPGIAAGREGMAFIRACVASSKNNAGWVAL